MHETEINYKLPTIDVGKIKKRFDLSQEEESIILGILYEPVNGVGILRATRPKHSGKCSWLWRNVMMFASPEEKFHTISTFFDSYLESYPDKEKVEEMLGRILDKVISTLSDSDLPGLTDWKDALGT